MTPEQAIKEVERLDEAATKGPWFWNPYRASLGQQDPKQPPNNKAQLVAVIADVPFHQFATSDAAFIAHARQSLPAMAAALKAALEEIEGAPHEEGCGSQSWYDMTEIPRPKPPCTCFKSRASQRVAERLKEL